MTPPRRLIPREAAHLFGDFVLTSDGRRQIFDEQALLSGDGSVPDKAL
jgi:hypothetical protein